MSFTSIGFNHLLYIHKDKPRTIAERYLKLMSLQHASEVLRNCDVISETRKEKRKIKGKWKVVIRYQLVCEIKKGVKYRVVVEKIGKTGKLHFLSVMPHNKASKPKKRPVGRA